MLVAGVDCSTQSAKVLLCDADDGTVVAEGSAPHPDGTECDPQAWWSALQRAGDGLIGRAAAIAVAGQQHGMVVLDGDGAVIRPALLWNDLRSAAAAADLVAELGGPHWWAGQTGSVPNASFTVSKLRWLAQHEPENAARVAAPAEVVGQTASGALIAPGTGDNMGAALGLGLEPGEVAVSVGTSGTAFAVTTVAAADDSGAVAGFADATGRFLPLVCTANAGLVLSAVAAMTGTDLTGLAQRALAAEPGAGGVILLPYFDGERTPDRPHATGVLSGLTTASATPENIARAAVEGVLASLADAADLLAGYGVEVRRVLLIGGGARSEAVRALAPGIFGRDVYAPEPREYVALGAARQAAWALAGSPEPPRWQRPPGTWFRGEPQPQVRERYAALRDATSSWAGGIESEIRKEGR
jgi:xylulokinase